MRAKLSKVKGELISTTASAHPRTRTLARQRPARALQLLRGARQQQGDHAPSATGSSGHWLTALRRRSQRTRTDLEADVPPRCPMATTSPHPAPLAQRPLRRQNPRQEPSALAAPAGICAGGGPSPRRRAVPTAMVIMCSRHSVRTLTLPLLRNLVTPLVVLGVAEHGLDGLSSFSVSLAAVL